MLNKVVAAAAAASIATAPALAQSASSPSAPASVDRAGAAVEGSQLRGGSYFAPALAALIVLLGVLTATGVIFDDDEKPVSP
jgi:hypothetical protein